MKKIATFFIVLFLLFISCKKGGDEYSNNEPSAKQFFKYIIKKGEHYANDNNLQAVQYSELKFITRFDNTAVYQTTDPANQEDVNKLFGFSDNNDQHQQFSARFGWNWARDSVRLYAYVYNNGQRDFKEITSIQPGNEINCSIKVNGNKYIFSANNITVEMPRLSTPVKSAGYKLYPYFGGDETAPHNINIWIKEL